MATKKDDEQKPETGRKAEVGDGAPAPEPKTCFIVTPIGEFGSPVNIKAFGLIAAVIEPVLAEFNFKPKAASDISSSGSINKQIIKHLVQDELVIANMTGLNPNVMYELAVRHAARKPIVLMCEKGQTLPFDLFDQRTVFYDDTLNGVKNAKALLQEFVADALQEAEVQNPIYDSIAQEMMLQNASTDETPLEFFSERLDRIEGLLRSQQQPTSRNPINTNSNVRYYDIAFYDKNGARITDSSIFKLIHDMYLSSFDTLQIDAIDGPLIRVANRLPSTLQRVRGALGGIEYDYTVSRVI